MKRERIGEEREKREGHIGDGGKGGGEGEGALDKIELVASGGEGIAWVAGKSGGDSVGARAGNIAALLQESRGAEAVGGVALEFGRVHVRARARNPLA
jgi:hypothetical protein